MDFFNSIDFAELIRNSQYTGLVIFSIAFLETLLFVGFVFPGSVALLAIGGLIASGYLELWPTLIWAFLGAVVGDNISFWIGLYFKKPLQHSSYYTNHQHVFHQGERFFQRYGIYSVALGRFVGPIRAVIPAVAGMMGMPGKIFLIVNVLSALFWAPAYILPGVFFGDIYNKIEQYIKVDYLTLFTILGIAIAIFIWIKKTNHKNKWFAYGSLFILSLFSLGLTQTTISN